MKQHVSNWTTFPFPVSYKEK